MPLIFSNANISHYPTQTYCDDEVNSSPTLQYALTAASYPDMLYVDIKHDQYRNIRRLNRNAHSTYNI